MNRSDDILLALMGVGALVIFGAAAVKWFVGLMGA